MMNFTLLLGATVPRPAPTEIIDALQDIEISYNLGQRSGFRITFGYERVELLDLLDSSLLRSSMLQLFNRVMVVLTLNARPIVLLDGIITQHEVLPSEEPNESRVVLMGEDVSVMMDLEEKSVLHVAQTEAIIAAKIIASYTRYGLIPKVIPPPVIEALLPITRIPSQQETDLAYLRTMADRFDYIFHIQPGPLPGSNQAYWGPAVLPGVPQPALTYNMGSFSNVTSLSVRQNGLMPTQVKGQHQDRKSNRIQPIRNQRSRRPPLARDRALIHQTKIRTTQYRQGGSTASQATAIAQGQLETASRQAVTLSGSLDTQIYGAVLEVGKLVGVRGLGATHDGIYYVQQVTHQVAEGVFTQQFELAREGTGTIAPIVRV
ncbi:MAG: hypothetical protein VKJ24_15550 [Synechococcales bacterium]|nr:hypothetical protein [Synechococcales bacterium]